MFFKISRRDRPVPNRLGSEEPDQKLAFAPREQEFRKVVEPVEGEMPSSEVQVFRGYAGGGRAAYAGQGGVKQGEPPHVARPIGGIGVADPCADVVAHHIERSVRRQSQSLNEAMDF